MHGEANTVVKHKFIPTRSSSRILFNYEQQLWVRLQRSCTRATFAIRTISSGPSRKACFLDPRQGNISAEGAAKDFREAADWR